jgi:hypothetical protein
VYTVFSPGLLKLGERSVMRSLIVLALGFCANPAAFAQVSVLPPAERKPTLVLETGGPVAPLSALVFAPDGQTLYTAGYD